MFVKLIGHRCNYVMLLLCALLVGPNADSCLAEDSFSPQTMTLQDVLSIVTTTNPEILEAMERYRSIVEERAIAESEYRPTIGVELSAGPEMTDGVETNDERENLNASVGTIYARQNLFAGGRSDAFINETDTRILSAAYDVLKVANQVYLDTAEAYVGVIQARDLLFISKENVLTQEKILVQVREKTDAGFNRISDLYNSEARLALARGNYISRQEDLNQAVVKLHRQLGRIILPESFLLPTPSYQFPPTVEETVAVAFRNHPALEVAKYNIQVRRYSYEKAKAAYWPTLDLELKAQHRSDTGGDEGDTDQASAMLKLNYTFYDGGLRHGEKGKNYQLLHREYQQAYVERRNVNQATRLAWNIMQAEEHKNAFLLEHVALSAKTLDAFKDEYHIGRRTLLDLLNMENEFKAAKMAKTESSYSHLIAYYRIAQATGALLHEFDTGLRMSIGLPPDVDFELEGYEELQRNRDEDSVQDVDDQCDTSVLGTTTPPSGCREAKGITLGYQRADDVGPYILPKAGTPTAVQLKIDTRKAEQSFDLEVINFEFGSANLTVTGRRMLTYVAEQLNAAANFNIEVVGHTDNVGDDEYNQELSIRRSRTVCDELITQGVAVGKLRCTGLGETAPVADNNTDMGREKNRRIEFKLLKQN